jgi:hypothetical protein
MAMERGVAAIVENGADMKKIVTDLISLVSAMERKSKPIMGLAQGKTTTIVHCVAQGPAKSPDNAQRVLCLGILHDHARGQEKAIAEMHGMEAHKIKEAFGNAIMRAAADRNQGVHLDRFIAKANEMNSFLGIRRLRVGFPHAAEGQFQRTSSLPTEPTPSPIPPLFPQADPDTLLLHSLTSTNQTSRKCPFPCHPSFERKDRSQVVLERLYGGSKSLVLHDRSVFITFNSNLRTNLRCSHNLNVFNKSKLDTFLF